MITRYYDRAAEVLLWLGWHFGLTVHHFNYESQDEDKTSLQNKRSQ